MPSAFISQKNSNARRGSSRLPPQQTQSYDEASRVIGKPHRLHDLRQPQEDAVETGLVGEIREAKCNYAHIEAKRTTDQADWANLQW